MISPAGQDLLRKVPVQAVPAPQAVPQVLPRGPGAVPMKIHSMDQGFPAVLTDPGQQRFLREAAPQAGPQGAAALQAAGK